MKWRASKQSPSSSAAGFTLLEVMVALAVLAIAMAALVSSGTQSASNAAYLRDKSLAHWVAMNRVADLRLQKAWPSPGESRSEEEMANRQWFCLSKVSTTDDPDLRRVEVEVRASSEKDAAPLERVIAFLPRTEQGGL